ncbi:MAG: Maf family protein [Thermoprotei archaeon]
MRIVLASSSKRRIELLRKFVSDLIVIPPSTSEIILNDPIKTVYENSKNKVLSVYDKTPHNSIIIGADTVVYNSEVGVIGKPASLAEARSILEKLRGKTHLVITGVYTLSKPDRRPYFFYEKSLVKFRDFSDEELSLYIASLEPLGKAGGYAIQGLASIFVEEIRGDFFNIVGLPISKLYRVLKRVYGIDLLEYAVRDRVVAKR